MEFSFKDWTEKPNIDSREVVSGSAINKSAKKKICFQMLFKLGDFLVSIDTKQFYQYTHHRFLYSKNAVQLCVYKICDTSKT